MDNKNPRKKSRKEKITIGLIEKVTVIGSNGSVETMAKFDTGAARNSIDYELAAKAGVGPVISSVKVKSASGEGRRPIVRAVIEVKGKQFKTRANLEDRSDMKYKVLIGRNLIYSNFIIDVEKSHTSHKENSTRDYLLNIASLKRKE